MPMPPTVRRRILDNPAFYWRAQLGQASRGGWNNPLLGAWCLPLLGVYSGSVHWLPKLFVNVCLVGFWENNIDLFVVAN